LKNKFLIKLNYVSNIKLKNIYTIEKFDKNNTLFNKRIFFFFFLFMYINKKQSIIFNEIIFLHKPKKKKKFNILRAPYKNKMAQNSYTWSRYNFSIILILFSNNIFLKDFYNNSFFMFNVFFKNILTTNVSSLKNFNINYKFNYKF